MSSEAWQWKKERDKLLRKGKTFYPGFVFNPDGAPAELVAALRSACAAIDLSDPTKFSDQERRFYRFIAKEGGFGVNYDLRAIPFLSQEGTLDVALNLGEQVMRLLPYHVKRVFFPYHHYGVVPYDSYIDVSFRSLRRQEGANGPLYFSTHRPTVDVGGRPRVVAFSKHAAERVLERVSAADITYPGLGDAFAVLQQCLEFEPVALPDGTPAFTVWDEAAPGFAPRRIAEAALGKDYDPAGTYSFLVGYFPAVVDGEFFKAKTLLFPGWRGTPEYESLLRAGLPTHQKAEWREFLDRMDALAFRTAAYPLLKWFHERGHDQVRSGKPNYAER